MKVVHVSSSDLIGGASAAAYRLHQALVHDSIDSWMFVQNKASSDSRVLSYDPPKHPLERAKRRVRRLAIRKSANRYAQTRPENLELFSDDRSPYGRTVLRQLPQFDIAHFHWISSFMEPSHTLRAISARSPIVWTLHDMNPFTGGCHFDMECGRYKNSCGRCPQLGSTQELDLSHQIFRRKLDAYSTLGSSQLRLVAPSKWLAAEVSSSMLLANFEIVVIPYSVNTECFKPHETKEMRLRLSIPDSSVVILFVADMTWNLRKGLDLLVAALKYIRDPSRVTVVTIGGGGVLLPDTVRHVHLGRVDSDAVMADAYSMADVFVAPSRQDNLPNAVLEAMASGTAVVAFEIGGMPDLVRHGETGLLARDCEPASLGASLDELLRSDELRLSCGRRSREIALSEYAPELQASRYTKLYETVLKEYERG